MADKSPNPKALANAEKSFKKAEEARVANQQVAEEVVRRDQNTARLKALRLERDRLERDRLETEAAVAKPKRAARSKKPS